MKRHVNLNRLWIALSTVFVIGLIFTYYFLIYVPDNEERITAKKYRTLKRIGQNFVIMKNDYERSVKQQIWDHLVNNGNCFQSKLIEEKNRDAAILKDSVKKAYDTLSTTKSHVNLLIDSMIRRLVDLDHQIRKLKKAEEECYGIKPALDRLNLGAIEFASEETWFNDRISRPDELFFFSDRKCTTLKISKFIENQSLLTHFDRFLVVRLFDSKKNNAWRNSFAVNQRFRTGNPKSPDSVFAFLAYQGKDYNERLGSENKILIDDLEGFYNRSHSLNLIPVQPVQISDIPYRMLSHVVEMASDEDWLLLGLLNDSDIKKQSRNVQHIVLIFLVLGSLFLILAMPVIKLLVMSPIERFQIKNVWFLGVSIVVGTAVAFIILFVSHHYQSYKRDYDQKLRTLANMVHDHFTLELSDIIKQLETPPDAIELHHLRVDNQPFFIKEKTLSDSLSHDDPYPFYNEMLLLNGEGEALLLLATHPVPRRNKAANLKGRDYFEHAFNNRLSSLVTKDALESNDSLSPFAVQSILSWNSRAHEAGISIRRPKKYSIATKTWDPSANLEVLAIATKLKSVMDPLLPPGYSFCLINTEGEVLFHSQKDKNLQENFFDEIGRNKKVQAAVEGRLQISLSLEYGEKKTLTHIRPLRGQPLYVITFFDQDYYNIPIVLTLGLAILVLGILFLIQGIHLMILFLTTHTSTKLKIKRFFMLWLRPRLSDLDNNSQNRSISTPWERGNLSQISNRLLKMPYSDRYLRGIKAMLILLPALVIIDELNLTSTRVLIISTITLPVILLALFFAMLNDNEKQTQHFIGGSISLLILIDLLALPYLKQSILTVIQFQFIITSIVTLAVWAPTYKSNTGNNERKPLNASYTWFLFSWLLMVSILPSFIIYKASFERESLIWERFIQWETISLLEQRKEALEIEFKALTANDAYPQKLKHRFSSDCDRYGNYLSLQAVSGPTKEPINRMHFTSVEEIEFHLRPESAGPLESSRKTLLANMHDKPWKWFVKENKLILKETGGTEISTVLPSFFHASGQYKYLTLLIFLILALIMGAASYWLITTSTKYIFGTGLLSDLLPGVITKIDNSSNRIRGNVRYRHIIVGPPYSGKTNMIKKTIADLNKSPDRGPSKCDDLIEFDLRTDRKFPSITANSNAIHLIKHFEYGINDLETNKFRLELIERLQEQYNARIIITSAVEPCLLSEVYERKIQKLTTISKGEEKDTPNILKELASVRASYRKWKNILAGFKVIHVSLGTHQMTPKNTLEDSELGFGTYLPKLKGTIRGQNEEEFILEVQEAASAYYHALWNSFSRNEKRILFDLAKDQFINLRDINPIRLLVKKGIIVMDNGPRMMNKSFTNFILSVVGEDEEVAMNNELKQKGTWQTVQLILAITIIGVIAFVALVQNEILSNLNATIATISGVIALLLRFSGLFVGEKIKETQ